MPRSWASLYLANVVEVPVGCSLLSQKLLVSIEHDMQVELLLQQHQSVMAEALDGAHGGNLAHPATEQTFLTSLVRMMGLN